MFKTIMSALDKNKNPSDVEINKIPSFIFCKWLSGNPNTIMAANQINRYSDIPMLNQYNMIKSAFGGKIKYIPYPKIEKEDTSKKIEYLMDYFKISSEKARDYLEVISSDEINKIVDMYTEYELKGKK